MPKVKVIGAYRFFFYSNESGEPPHIHIKAGSSSAKFWLTPVELARSVRFASHELRTIERLVKRHREDFVEAWSEHFTS